MPERVLGRNTKDFYIAWHKALAIPEVVLAGNNLAFLEQLKLSTEMQRIDLRLQAIEQLCAKVSADLGKIDQRLKSVERPGQGNTPQGKSRQ